MNIERYIPTGRENAITRPNLCRASGLNDRAMRIEIEEARNRGVIIINNQDGRGYYQTDDIREIENQYKQNDSRAMAILVQQKHLRQRLIQAGRLKEVSAQMSLFH